MTARKPRHFRLYYVTLCFAILFVGPDSFLARCIGVTDGDTIEVLRDHSAIKVRLEGIDCSERAQDFGQKAKQFTSGLVFGKTVGIRLIGEDQFGRTVAKVIVDGKDISVEPLKAGLAWHFKKYSKDQGLAEIENQVRKNRVGLWSMPSPVAPWDYRHPPSIAPSATSEPYASRVYHGNAYSHVFHAPNCPQYNCKNCTKELPSREAAMRLGSAPVAFANRELIMAIFEIIDVLGKHYRCSASAAASAGAHM